MSAQRRRTFIVLLGPPASGKGTQARMLQQRLGLTHVSSGELFRNHLRQQTSLGLLAQSYTDRGQLVPDEVTIRMVAERLTQPDCARGAVLDGFPRTLPQVVALEKIVEPYGGLSIAPLLDVSDDDVMLRISGRHSCRTCGAVYHDVYHPPKVEGVCDIDGGELYQRDDDRPETVQHRLYVYYKQTSPLVGYFFARGLLVDIDGSQAAAAVQQDLLRAFAERGLIESVAA